MLTSVANWKEFSTAGNPGVDAALLKPVRQKKLMETLVSAWSKRHSVLALSSNSPHKARDVSSVTETGEHVACCALKPESHPEFMRSSMLRLSGNVDHFRGSAGARVLLVEDNAVNQKVALLLLAKLGFRADAACDGRKALEMLEMSAYDLVFMDCQMPEMNGYEATTQIRLREGSGPRIPIIALTADAAGEYRERCLEAGMDDVITKPVTLQDLDRALATWLERMRAEAVPLVLAPSIEVVE
jgi:CheY-like chemotaxis protein